ncbi:MAG TPA: hypothetical protein VIH02_07315 [Flavobacterium sp.]
MNIKNIILIVSFLVFAVFANAQDSLQRKFHKTTVEIKSQKLNEVLLDKDLQSKRNSKCLNYKCDGNSNVSYCNENSDENYIEFQELGKIQKTELIVINKLTYNEEFYILLNKLNCSEITVEGFPLSIENTNKYIIYNNPSTDKAWKIQILKIEKGNAYLQDEIIFPDNIHPKKVLRLEQNEIFILDEKNQTWKTVVKN